MASYYKWMSLFAFLFCLNISQAQAKEASLNYHITRNNGAFSTIFDMATDKFHIGKVIKSRFHIATHYDCYDRSDLYECQGICHVFCLGSFYTWATKIDVYNLENQKIGTINGQLETKEPAKFSFHDVNDKCIATAYLDENCVGFSLVDPNDSSFILARLNYQFVEDKRESWNVIIYYPDLISLKLIKVFAAFAYDNQDAFKSNL